MPSDPSFLNRKVNFDCTTAVHCAPMHRLVILLSISNAHQFQRNSVQFQWIPSLYLLLSPFRIVWWESRRIDYGESSYSPQSTQDPESESEKTTETEYSRKYVFNLTTNWWDSDHYIIVLYRRRKMSITFPMNRCALCGARNRIRIVLCLRASSIRFDSSYAVVVDRICYRNRLNAPRERAAATSDIFYNN